MVSRVVTTLVNTSELLVRWAAAMIGVDGFHDAGFIKIAGEAAEETIVGIAKEKIMSFSGSYER